MTCKFAAVQIAFYAPLKPPGHPVPSGDRHMARQIMVALRLAGHNVDLVSDLRSYLSEPSKEEWARLAGLADAERQRIGADWETAGRPGLWITYHPYYKAPDLLGPSLCRLAAVPYVTIEASLSAKRSQDSWGELQSMVLDAVEFARVNICFTARDHKGLGEICPRARRAMLAPFIDTSAYSTAAPDMPGRLVTVAMMRAGDKFASYRMLAESLAIIKDKPWSLAIIGGGRAEPEVRHLFRKFEGDRIAWLGEAEPVEIPALLAAGGIYVWPGFGEAYGLSYLEAQAAGLPVVAQNIAGVPEVVRHEVTGLLTPPGDAAAYSAAIVSLMTDAARRTAMRIAARRFVHDEHSLPAASRRLDRIVAEAASCR